MNDRTINYFEFPEREPDWAKLKQAFKRHISKFNVPFFEAGSEEEQAFLHFCGISGLKVVKKSIVEYGGKGPDEGRFLFLCLKPDNGTCVSPGVTSFLDLTTACPGGGAFGLCGRGAKQVGRVQVKPEGVEKIRKMGMLIASYPMGPSVILLSETVANALENSGVTGCEIVATETQGCRQLRIMAETSGPARVGTARMGRRCPACGVAKMFLSDSGRYFHAGDLRKVDIQSCRQYYADNVGGFEIINGFPIISQRVFDLLLSLKVKGLDRYSTDPPVQHAVVQVRQA